MKRDDVVTLLIVFALIALTGYGAVWGFVDAPRETVYEYQVKTEQVEQAQTVNDSITYESLTQEEKDVLFRAFKKTDHFLGGASAYVEAGEPLNVSSEWRIVRIKGVPLLVAFYGPEEYVRHSNHIRSVLGFTSMIVLVFLVLFALSAIRSIKQHGKIV